jgi:hypothetical protein
MVTSIKKKKQTKINELMFSYAATTTTTIENHLSFLGRWVLEKTTMNKLIILIGTTTTTAAAEENEWIFVHYSTY